MAMVMILALSGAAVLTMKYVSISAKHIADSYTKEQAELFAQSVLEATIMKIQGYDRSTNSDCLRTLSFKSPDGRFDASVTIERYYLYNGKDNDGSSLSNCSIVKAIHTPESHGYVTIDIVVQTNGTNDKIGSFISPVRVMLRSLQRI